jgi:hypothetical protein
MTRNHAGKLLLFALNDEMYADIDQVMASLAGKGFGILPDVK